MNAYALTLTDGRQVIAYPFPLSNGQVATIELPVEPLTDEDAERLSAFVLCLPIPHEEAGKQTSGERRFA